MLKINKLSKSFDNTKVLDEISFEAVNGSITALLGKNGSGKTTILRILADLVSEDSGSITLDSRKIKRGDSSFITNNDRSFFWRLSSYENLRYFLSMSGTNKDILDESIYKLADVFDIKSKLHNIFSSLSAGEKKKISLIRMLLKDQKIMLFDEVTTNLDLETKNLLINYLKNTHEDKITLWVTHNLDELNGFANNYVLLSDSKVKKMSTFKEFKKDFNYLSQQLNNE